jgi:hypothetical protein
MKYPESTRAPLSRLLLALAVALFGFSAAFPAHAQPVTAGRAPRPGATSSTADCGTVPPASSRATADRCVVEAFRAHRAFTVTYETLQGGDRVLESYEGDAHGAVAVVRRLVLAAPGGASPGEGHLVCDGPHVARVSGAERLECTRVH